MRPWEEGALRDSTVRTTDSPAVTAEVRTALRAPRGLQQQDLKLTQLCEQGDQALTYNIGVQNIFREFTEYLIVLCLEMSSRNLLKRGNQW